MIKRSLRLMLICSGLIKMAAAQTAVSAKDAHSLSPWSIGVRGGFSIPNLTAGGSDKNPLNTGYGSRLGPDAALFAEYRFSPLFSLQPMVEYSSQGGKKNGFQAFPTPAQAAPLFPPGEVPTYLYGTFKSEAKLNYLLIPILAKFSWHPGSGHHGPWRIYIDAGPFAGFLLSAKQVTTGASEIYLDPQAQMPLAAAGTYNFNNTQDIKSQLHTFNFGIEGNLGAAYQFGRNSVFAEGGGNYGFLNIQKGSANGKNNAGAATAVIGYAYRLAR